MSSKVDIANMSLGHIGIGKTIGNLAEEGNLEHPKSQEARWCNVYIDQCRQEILEARDWNVCRGRISLALTGGTAPTNWTYEYAYPNLCLSIRSLIMPGVPWLRKDQKIPYEVAATEDQTVIWTDLEFAEAVFTRDISDTTRFKPLLIGAWSYLLASKIAIPLAVKPDMAAQARDGYGFMFVRAENSDAREGETGPEPESEYMTYRNA